VSARVGIDWSTVADLGHVSDAALAERLGVSEPAVWAARRRLGIPARGAQRWSRVALPPDLAEALELDATDLGLTLDELVVGCLREQFGVVAP